MLHAAVVGLGWWGRHMVRRLAPSDKVEILRAVDTKPSTAADFAAEHGLPLTDSLDEVLADPAIDAVLLCTPHSHHTRQVAAVAAAGKQVFCEKPLALTRREAEQSVATCRAAGVMLGVGHERRFEPAMLEVQRLVESGELGTIMHVESNFSHDKLANVPAGDWRTSSKEAPAAAMTAMGIHLTDAYLGLFGAVAEVYAMTARRVLPHENGDVLSVALRFTSGATGFVSAILKTPHYLRLAVFGADAWVEVRNHTHPDTPGPATLTLQRSGAEPIRREYQWRDTVRANVESFADAIAARASYPFTDAEKIANIAILEAVTRSATQGAAVAVL